MRHHRLPLSLLSALALACPAQTTITPRADLAARRVDERRPEQPFTVDLFGRMVQFGGSWQYTDERRDNFDLDSVRARDRRVREHELQFEAGTRLGPDTRVFAQIKALHEARRTQGSDGKRVTRTLERGQWWVQQDRIAGSPWSLQVGRVPLLDRRAWWWDEDLDAVRARRDAGSWRLDTGVARELLRKSSDQRGVAAPLRGVTRWFGHASWPWANRHALDAFWLLQADRSPRPAVGAVFTNEDATDPSDFRARWVGLRASGEWRATNGPRLAYWADTAWLSGQEQHTAFAEQDDGTFIAGTTTGRRVRGNAMDFGATGSLPLPLRPSLTVAHARGSTGFRQTGLQENKVRFAGVKRWQRYGELLQPELSNLAVTTVGAGVRVLDNSSIELLAHSYRQVKATNSLADSRLSTEPEGLNRSIGREVDLVVAVREWPHVEFTVSASRFKPGAAFAPGQRDAAHAVEISVSINF